MIQKIYNQNKRQLEKRGMQRLNKSNNTIWSPEKIQARDGCEIVAVQYNEKTISLNSKYRPLEEAQRWAELYSQKLISHSVLLLFGFGNGLFIRALLKLLPTDAEIIIYEPAQEIFEFVIEEFDISDILAEKRIYLAVNGWNPLAFRSYLKQIVSWENMELTEYTSHAQYERLFPEEYRQFITEVKDSLTMNVMKVNTEIQFAPYFRQNVIHNLKYIFQARTICDYFGVLPWELPIIIVSAGPSLNKNVSALKEAKGKALILATDTSLNVLFRENIIPDIFVTIDPRKSMAVFYDNRFIDVPMICTMHSNYTALSLHRGIKIFYENGFGYVDSYYRLCKKQAGSLENGGSVAHTAFSFAKALGTNKIIFVGQDLALTGDRKHADGIYYEKDPIYEDPNTIWIDDIYGNRVRTKPDFYQYLRWFEEQIASMPDRSFIDATEGGAKITGTKLMTLEEVIKQELLKEYPITEMIEHTKESFSVSDKQKIFQNIVEIPKRLKRVEEIAKRGVEVSNQFLNAIKNKVKWNNGEHRKLSEELDSIYQVLNQMSERELVMEYMKEIQYEVERDLYRSYGQGIEAEIAYHNRGIKWMQGILSALEEMQQDIQYLCNEVTNTYENEGKVHYEK